MKKYKIAVLLLVTLLLTGCAQINVTCGVDREKNAYLTLEAQVDWTEYAGDLGADLEESFRSLATHYRSTLGFEVEETYTDTGCRLILTKKQQGQSYAEAFRLLEAMLTDESVTPFLDVKTTYAQQPQVEGYALEVTMDTGRILEEMGAEDLPGDWRDYYLRSLEASTGSLTLELPASEQPEGQGVSWAEGFARRTTQVDLQGQTTLKLATQAAVWDGAVVTGAAEALDRQAEAAGKTVLLAALVLVAGLTAAVVLGRRRARPE